MALIVEDGTGLANAESYLSVAGATTHHAAYGNAAWSAGSVSDTQREVALRQATRYLDLVYGTAWQGSRATTTQILDWPRYDVWRRDDFAVASNEVPIEIQKACAELAVRALSEDILPDIADAATIASESLAVGPISTSTVYVDGKRPFTTYRIVDSLVRQLVDGFGGVVERVRS